MTATGKKAGTRRRTYTGPALFSHGFRPFFLFGALYAGLALPIWLTMLLSGLELPGSIATVDWHVHEMIFGYLAAIVAGFVLTAIPNWTGRLPVMGLPLVVMLLVWLAGRATMTFVPSPWAVLITDCTFLVLLSGLAWREVLSGRNWRNVPICLLISLFAAANVLFHLSQEYAAISGYGERVALGVAAVLIGMIGGRITPSFTRNWMVRLNVEPLPVPFARFDLIALLGAAAAMACWVVAPEKRASGVLLVIAGVMHFARLFRWRGGHTLREPVVAILHVGYGWLTLGFVLMGSAILVPTVIDASSALHSLTAGAIGTMTLAVMTRASLGHTGREITANMVTLTIYTLVTIGALLRTISTYLPLPYEQALVAGGIAWSSAFLLFFIAYAPILLRTRNR